uniref:DUF4378 domain-containing protein n=1 Tax=Kalanchoe fedtschenkoi TaxID=63787 RepID=A0A7N0UU42_KALFE
MYDCRFNFQDLNGPYHPSSSAIISSSDPSRIQNAAEDPALITDKSEQDSPVSVLDKFFEDASPAQITTQPVKPRNQPLHINFDEPSPGQRVKLHPATTSGYSSPSKNHALLSGAAEYSRKVLAASGLLDWYQLALKWHCSTDQMLDTATYTMVESESESESESPLETQLLFDHINEVLLDMYQPYYPWVPLGRPNNSMQHVVAKRKLVDEVIDIVEGNLLLLIREQQQAPVQHQKLAVSAMEKCGRWMDMSGELEDMVLEMAEEIEEEIVDEFVFEQWID